jgi:spermidine synthase
MWKTKLGICIYESPSGYKVYQNLLYRWLTLGSPALQTVINRLKPQKPVLRYLRALTLMARHYPERACVLGLGGAGVALMLSDKITSPPLVAIEKSEEVIDIAKRFFFTERLNNFTIIHEDAVEYVQKNQNQFPHLMVDLYNANYFPPECNNELFFNSCQQMLTQDGFAVFNLANHKEQWQILQSIKKFFRQTLIIPVKKTANMVIIAAPFEDKEKFLNIIQSTGEIKRILWVQSWGNVADY